MALLKGTEMMFKAFESGMFLKLKKSKLKQNNRVIMLNIIHLIVIQIY